MVTVGLCDSVGPSCLSFLLSQPCHACLRCIVCSLCVHCNYSTCCRPLLTCAFLPRPLVGVASTAEATLDLVCSLYKSTSADEQRREVLVAALQDNWSTFYSESISTPTSYP